jgi:hypothetical protein
VAGLYSFSSNRAPELNFKGAAAVQAPTGAINFMAEPISNLGNCRRVKSPPIMMGPLDDQSSIRNLRNVSVGDNTIKPKSKVLETSV